jgi:hypothetical protein
MRTLCEVKWESEEQPLDGDVVYEKAQYILHHWGLQFKIIDTGDGTVAVGNYSVAICENCKTGDIEIFLPEQVKIIGTINDKK